MSLSDYFDYQLLASVNNTELQSVAREIKTHLQKQGLKISDNKMKVIRKKGGGKSPSLR